MDSSTTNDPKMEQDCSHMVKELLPQVDQLVASGKLPAALDQLHALEKKTRAAADLWSTTQLLERIVDICAQAQEWVMLEQQVAAMAKKHAQLKQAITKMVQKAMTYLDQAAEPTRIELIDGLRKVTEGKMFVEVEYARLTRMRANIYEQQGQINKAADLLQEVQVETSMDRREKTDFILEQMRLCLAKRDFIRMAIISRKINQKYFEHEGTEDLKLRYFELMIQYDVHEENYLEVSRHYYAIYTMPSIKADASKWPSMLQNMVLYLVMAPYGNEQADMLHRIQQDHNLETLPHSCQLVKIFTTMELTRWSVVEQNTDKQVLRDRVIEHNVRVIAKYYLRATIQQLTRLLELSADEVETFISKAVVSGTIYARIDRPAGIVTFAQPREGEEQLNAWASDVNKLLSLVEKTTHLISKEEIVNKIARAI
ncbi:proteasome regulatory particle subunit [Coemansia sp. RSA 989]|nr:proteasome regulatory particle subunit [Coemansia sp. RSA 1821]KAJ1865584.1 proteasome regulatory particle subunit [Coemansia sp. RSA 989]KAJ1873489.1 proteasome regulatory particle subunit [Coemansia sp. RSA 990]KAJ2675605.1 proteasome regulatory particle subunit [Coemansia sp. RSA 1085]